MFANLLLFYSGSGTSAPPPDGSIVLIPLIMRRRRRASVVVAGDFLGALANYLVALPSVGGTFGTDPWGNTKVYLRSAPPKVNYPFLIITPITSVDVVTNSPTTAWRMKRYQYDVFASTPDSTISLGKSLVTALSQVAPKMTYAVGAEFLRYPMSSLSEPTLTTLAGKGGQPEWRSMIEIMHQVAELY